MRPIPLSLLLCAAALAGCGENNTESYVQSPGEDAKPMTRALETGAELRQDHEPIDAVSTYLNGFHFYNGDMDGQMEAHHYVTVLNEDLMQAVIYDGNTASAKLMGVEYIISERLYKTLPPEEKALWHSHHHEVKSGTLVAPAVPRAAEDELMKKIVSTYGKTWHTWHTDRNQELPLGIPALMMGFTKDGQLDPHLLSSRDRRFRMQTEEVKQRRQSIPMPAVDADANAWERGKVIQLQRVEGPGEHAQGHAEPDRRDTQSELTDQSREGNRAPR